MASSFFHPNYWTFVNVLKKEEAYVRNTKEATRSNHQEGVMLIAAREFWELPTITLTTEF